MSIKKEIAGPLLLVLASVAISACRAHEFYNTTADDSIQPSVERPTPVLVLLGGFASCTTDSSGRKTPRGMGLEESARELLAEIADSTYRTLGHFESPPWVRACFDKTGKIFFHSFSQLDYGIQETDYEHIGPLVSTIVAESHNRPVFFVGHSHGAWLALKIMLNSPASVSIGGLVTIDPISRINCGISEYAAALAIGTSLEGCQEAPTDFSPALLQVVANRIPMGSWKHFYQTIFYPLHSGPFLTISQPIDQRDVSAYLTPVGIAAGINPHTKIYTLSAVWSSLRKLILTDERP